MGKIILIDDKKRRLDAIVKLAQNIGYSDDDILTFRYADKAFREISELYKADVDIDAIVTDYHLYIKPNSKSHRDIGLPENFVPEIKDGATLISKVKKILPDVPAVIVSAGLNDSVVKHANEVGADLSLYKRMPGSRKYDYFVKVFQELKDNGVNSAKLFVANNAPIRMVRQQHSNKSL